MRAKSLWVSVSAAAALVLTAMPSAAAAAAAVDAFIWFENVHGEATDGGHKGWIEVSSFSFGASSPSTVGGGASAAMGRAGGGNSVRIVKATDSASPALQQASMAGKHFAQVTLEMRKAGGEHAAYLTYVMHDVMISSVSLGGGGGGGDRPQESLTLNFTKVEMRNSAGSPEAGAMPPPGH